MLQSVKYCELKTPHKIKREIIANKDDVMLDIHPKHLYTPVEGTPDKGDGKAALT